MKLLRRRKRETRRDQGFPPDAHGRRNLDGSYFSIWRCQRGHGEVGEPDSPPARCMDCLLESSLEDSRLEPTTWTLATPRQASDFMWTMEGLRMYDGVGFTLSEEVLRP